MKKVKIGCLLFFLFLSLTACAGQSGTGAEELQSDDSSENVESNEGEKRDNVSQDMQTDKAVGEFDLETHTVLLNSGYEMPIMGLGTYSLTDEECYNSVTALLEAGGRLIGIW